MHDHRPSPFARLVRAGLGTLFLAASSAVFAAGAPAPSAPLVDALRVEVAPGDNRAVSFTNKRSAFWYTATHVNDHPEHAAYAGLNIAKRQVTGDYVLQVDGRALGRADATVSVYPHLLERRYAAGEVERLALFDARDLVEISLDAEGDTIGLRLDGVSPRPRPDPEGLALFAPAGEAPGAVVVGAIGDVDVAVNGETVVAPAAAGGFFVAWAEDAGDAAALVAEARAHAGAWKAERKARMEAMLRGPAWLETDDGQTTRALRWLVMTMDQLVTRQQGDGIYAGLPWFNEYWGRDSFIALPGALLVTGQFEAAAQVLRSFAGFQDTDPASRFFGRMPNIVNPELVDYHTTDGTPHFVIELARYVDYTGDTALARELFPAVRASIEGSLANWTDANGYLVHADNETWMDARRAEDLVPYSPRGDRANDIQALWHGQLTAGAGLARRLGDEEAAARWEVAARTVRERFARDYRQPGTPWLADRLLPDGTPDFRLRPNGLYALDLVEDEAFRVAATRASWEALVYPWGVASLEQGDPFFHPYHRAPDLWHKDEAYHNGAVWLWNNGIAMQRMVEAGQPDVAWRLFAEMNRQALERGVVGGLAENADAYPRPGEAEPRLTGTYLQAWSNAEQLRVWYRHFLGVRPALSEGRLTLAPRLPGALSKAGYQVRIGAGTLHGDFARSAGGGHWEWRRGGPALEVDVDWPPFPVQRVQLPAGGRLLAEARHEALHLRALDAERRQVWSRRVSPSAERQAEAERREETLRGVRFAEPWPLARHPVMNRDDPPPLPSGAVPAPGNGAAR